MLAVFRVFLRGAAIMSARNKERTYLLSRAELHHCRVTRVGLIHSVSLYNVGDAGIASRDGRVVR